MSTATMSKLEAYQALSEGKITVAECMAITTEERGLTVKANAESRCISLYGLGRMPISLYRSQWNRLGLGPDSPVMVFIAKYGDYLPVDKGDKAKAIPKDLIGEGKPFRFVTKND